MARLRPGWVMARVLSIVEVIHLSRNFMAFKLKNGDCLELMAHIPSGSVDMIQCDQPY